MIALGLYIILLCLSLQKNFQNLSKYSLSEVHFDTGRFLFEFNRLIGRQVLSSDCLHYVWIWAGKVDLHGAKATWICMVLEWTPEE